MDLSAHPITSLDVLRKLSLYLNDYFTSNRQETCFDLSGPLLPLKHYPTRFQKTLIDYQMDNSKPVKHYFSSVDLRKRLTSFSQKTDNEERFQKIIHKIEEVITDISAFKTQNIKDNENRLRPWDNTWWKTNVKSFQATRFLNQYGSARSQRKFYLQQSNMEIKRSKKPKVKIYPNHGSQPILKMTPHPFASRGEAERIINHAAKLLLVTENYDVDAYEYTASGMKIKPTAKKPKRYSVKNKISKVNKTESSVDKSLLKKVSSGDSISVTGGKTNAFKIKKIIYGKDLAMEDSVALVRNNTDEDGPGAMKGLFANKRNTDSLDKNDDDHDLEKDKTTKAGSKSCCMCSKATSVIPTNEVSNPEVVQPVTIHQSSYESQESEATVSIYAVKNPPEPTTLAFHKREIPETHQSAGTMNDETPIKPVEASPDHVVEGWLKHGSSTVEKAETMSRSRSHSQENDNCHVNSSNVTTKQIFEIKVVTGDRIGASTNASVWFHITGDLCAMKQSVELTKSANHRRPFTRGNTDTFKIKSSRFLGKIQSIQIGHDSDQPGSDWFLESVSVRDCVNQMSYYFPCSKWLSVRTDDKQTRVNILPQPYMHIATIHQIISKITKSDIGIQCNDLEDSINSTAGFKQHKKNDKHQSARHDSISDLVVEFSDISFSETSASSLMSVRRNERYAAAGIFDLCNPLLDDVKEEANISIKENVSDIASDLKYNYDIDFITESLNENAEDSYSPNPISFCDEDTS